MFEAPPPSQSDLLYFCKYLEQIHSSISQVMKDIGRSPGKFSALYTHTQNPLLF